MVGDFSVSQIIGRNIQSIRRQHKLRQSDICITCNITQDKLSKIEHGITHLSVDLLVAIAECLKVPVFQLLAGVPGVPFNQEELDVLEKYRSDDKFKMLVDMLIK